MSGASSGLQYPHGLDLVWIACNRAGQVAAFVTAGAGPMPPGALMSFAAGLDAEAAIASLPSSTTVSMRVELPDAESFMTLGSRGVYVFDWPDAGAANGDHAGPYDLVCIPRGAIAVNELPSSLRLAAQANVLEVDSFSDVDFVWVDSHAG